MIIETEIIKVSSNKIYSGCHWRTRARLKEDYLLLTNPFKKLAPIKDKVDLEFSFFFKRNALDSSNCSYMGKMLEDCLVTHGVLKNDTIKEVGKVSYSSEKGEKDFCIIKIKK